MGEAQRKKRAVAALKADVEAIAHAMRQVIGASSAGYGADCVAYALTGAEVLRRRGHAAQAVAGSAAWRVGPGVGDVLTHAVELYGGSTGAFSPGQEGAKAAMFHAWVQVGEHYVDFTTFSIADKAKMLDAADGMETQVKWCPEFLLVEAASCSTLEAVPQGWKEGLYAYVRHEEVERVVLEQETQFDACAYADLVQVVARGGRATLAFSLGPDGIRGIDDARAKSQAEGLRLADLSQVVPK